MKSITIEKFAKKYVERNKDENLKDVKIRLKEALERKNSGGECSICGEPIWAIGSAVGGFEGCFTCITGESDGSQDYEII